MSVLKANGRVIQISPDNLPDATPLGKGGVKQGLGIAKLQYVYSDDNAKINEIIDALRASRVIPHDKFVVFYDMNADPAQDNDKDDWGSYPEDLNYYLAGESASVMLVDDEKGYTPWRRGYRFLGWARSKNANVPDFAYDHNSDEENQPSYSLTFTDDDITLYAVWEVVYHQITYHTGEYATGDVPETQTVQKDSYAAASFDVNLEYTGDGDKVFLGWSESPDSDYASYTSNGNSQIYVYEDIDLYPVFGYAYTLSFALGNDGEGDLPDGGTYVEGQYATVPFTPHPTCKSDSSRSFIGWAESDGASWPSHDARNGGMSSMVYMSQDITLYPVFASNEQGGGGDSGDESPEYINIDNTYGGVGIEVYYYDEDSDAEEEQDKYIRVLTVNPGSTGSFNHHGNFNPFYIQFANELPAEHGITASYKGDTEDGSYSEKDPSQLQIGGDYNSRAICYPDSTQEDWHFGNHDNGTLTISDPNADIVRLDYDMGSSYDGGSTPDSVTAQRYSDIDVDFVNHPYRNGYNFLGWSEESGSSVASYYEGMDTPTIYMDDNKTLYPVFESNQGEGNGDSGNASTNRIYITNTSSYDVSVSHPGGKDPISDDISSGYLDFTPGVSYSISISGKEAGSNVDAKFSGTFGSMPSYSDTDCLIDSQIIHSPGMSGVSTWKFSDGDSGTLTISPKQQQQEEQPSGNESSNQYSATITIANTSGDDVYIEDEDKKTVLLTVSNGSTETYNCSENVGYQIRSSSSKTCSISGTYNGSDVGGSTMQTHTDSSYDYWKIDGEDGYVWTLANNDAVTLSFSGK